MKYSLGPANNTLGNYSIVPDNYGVNFMIINEKLYMKMYIIYSF